MEVNFAVYGDRNGAHGLRMATFENVVVEKTLQITDLAWNLPDQLGAAPMYRGRPSGDFYVLVKTVRDSNASRSGMAISVAAFFPLGEFSNTNNLRMIIDNLPEVSHRDSLLKTQSIQSVSDPYVAVDAAGIQAMSFALLNHEGSGPVVWADSNDFIDIVSGFWNVLTPDMRKEFAFAFICDQGDGNQHDCSVVYCPEEVASRFSSRLIVRRDALVDRGGSTVHDYVADESTRQEIQRLILQLGAQANCFNSLRRVFQCYETLPKIAEISTLSETIIIRNIAILSPNPRLGQDIKATVISDLCRRIESEGSSAIALIRNIDFDVFAASETIEAACSVGTLHELQRSQTDIPAVADLLEQAMSRTDRCWARGVVAGIKQFVKLMSNERWVTMWRILELQKAPGATFDLIPLSDRIDSVLSANAPHQIGNALAEMLNEVSQRKGLRELYAVTAATLYEAQAAMAKICEQWNKKDRLISLRRLAHRIGNKKFFSCLNATSEEEAIEVTAEICISSPATFVSSFLGRSKPWRQVFVRVFALSPDTIKTSNGLEMEVDTSLQMIIDDVLEAEYQLALSATKFSNLLNVKNREKLWPRLSSEALPNFVNSTAAAWIAAIQCGTVLGQPEDEISRAVLSNIPKGTVLPFDSENAIEIVINVFNALPQLTEDVFEDWRQKFLNQNRRLSKVGAILLGTFVHQRQWKAVAGKLAEDVNWYRREDLRPTVSQFLPLLGWIDRFMLGDSDLKVSPDEWWPEFASAAIKLYPEGPATQSVWERAGGSLGDLLTEGTGISQWHYCLRQLRNGIKSGEVSLKSLLKIVSEDYANNATIKILVANRPK